MQADDGEEEEGHTSYCCHAVHVIYCVFVDYVRSPITIWPRVPVVIRHIYRGQICLIYNIDWQLKLSNYCMTESAGTVIRRIYHGQIYLIYNVDWQLKLSILWVFYNANWTLPLRYSRRDGHKTYMERSNRSPDAKVMHQIKSQILELPVCWDRRLDVVLRKNELPELSVFDRYFR